MNRDEILQLPRGRLEDRQLRDRRQERLDTDVECLAEGKHGRETGICSGPALCGWSPLPQKT